MRSAKPHIALDIHNMAAGCRHARFQLCMIIMDRAHASAKTDLVQARL